MLALYDNYDEYTVLYDTYWQNGTWLLKNLGHNIRKVAFLYIPILWYNYWQLSVYPTVR